MDGNVHTDDDLLLRKAAENGHTATVKALLQAGADVHADSDFALRLATQRGHISVVKVLLEAGADIDSALRNAAQHGQTALVESLLAEGANVNAGPDRYEAPLVYASVQGHTDTVKALLAAGVNIHIDRALRIAAQEGHTDIVKMLIDQGADVHSRSSHNLYDNALLSAVQNEHVSTVEALLKAGANVHAEYDKAFTTKNWIIIDMLKKASPCKYNVEKTLGQGSFGLLYLVEDVRDGRKYALKTGTEPYTENVQISEPETAIHLHVHHPYLMSGIDVFRPNDVKTCGSPLDGVSQGILLPLGEYDLGKIMNDDDKDVSKRAYPAFDSMCASWQLACALEALYTAGYTHHDIKPFNILQKGDTTLLSDFGYSIWSETPSIDYVFCTSWYRPPYVHEGTIIPSKDYMAVDLYSLGLTYMDITCGASRPVSTPGDETMYVHDLAEETHARLDELITWLDTNRNYPGFVETRQKRWRLPLPSVDAFIEYLQIIKMMVSKTPTALTATDVRLRLEALWPAHPPAPVLRKTLPPPMDMQYMDAARTVLDIFYATGYTSFPARARTHALHLFLAVMACVSQKDYLYPRRHIKVVFFGDDYTPVRKSWMLPYLYACIIIANSFYPSVTTTDFFSFEDYRLTSFYTALPYTPILYSDGSVTSSNKATTLAYTTIRTSEELRGQFNW